MSQTIFEKIIEREIPADIVYEDDLIVAFLDAHPVTPGHTLVITRTPYPTYNDVPEEELSQLMNVAQKIGRAVLTGVHASGYNIHINCGVDAGQVVPHVHVHVIPRFKGDSFEHWHGDVHQTDQERRDTAEAIAQAL